MNAAAPNPMGTIEITKTISLAAAFPQSLLELTLTGVATLTLPESLFDADHPGHYLRRIKTVTLVVPTMAPPDLSPKCTLTQTSSMVRTDTLEVPSSVGRRATSIRQESTTFEATDDGLCGLDFHAFEGTGVASTWTIDLTAPDNAIDPARLGDLVVEIRYTACDGGAAFRSTVLAATASAEAAGERPRPLLLRASCDQARGWDDFLCPPRAAAPVLSFDLTGYLGRGARVRNLKAVALGSSTTLVPLSFSVRVPGADRTYTLTTPDSTKVSFGRSTLSPAFVPVSPPAGSEGPWLWTFTAPPSTDLSEIVDLWFCLTYTPGP